MKPITYLLVLWILSVSSASGAISGKLINTKVERTVDLTSQFVRQVARVTVENSGSQDADAYYVAFTPEEAGHLSLLSASDESGVLQSQKADVENGFQLFKISLRSPLKPDQSLTFKVSSILTHFLKPFPSSIAQGEKQFVVYHGNHFFSSPYSTQTQTTNVKLASSNIKSNSELPPTSKKAETITYGPYEDREAFSFSELKVHYENNKPFLTVNSLVKEIEVSHWGNVAVEETYTLTHDGAALKGTFSRYDFQRNPYGSPSAVTVMKQLLPASATDVYYRDEIGNVTTSHLSSNEKNVIFELTPRYPLFGGWKAAWYQGYNLASSGFLFTSASDSSLYVLNVTFATTFDDVVIDHHTLRVILPEGATNIQVHTPFDVSETKHSLHFTYLDTSGRPVVSVEKKNLVSAHNQYFQVTYHFGRLSLLHEPFLLVSAFFVFFLIVMVYMRSNFSIGETKKSLVSEKVEDLFLQVKDLIDQFSDQHDALDKALEKYLATKNAGGYKNERDNIFRAISNLSSSLRSAIIQVESLDADLAKKLREVERKQDQKLEDQKAILELAVNFADKKVSKEAYENRKADKENSFSAASEEIQEIFDDLASL